MPSSSERWPTSPAGRSAGVLDRLPRQPRGRHRADRPRHPGRQRRPCARLPGRRLPAGSPRRAAHRRRTTTSASSPRTFAEADRTQRQRALILVESVYSVLGDAAPLADLAAVVAEQYDAVLVVDEAHALGVSGPGGRGLVHAAGLADARDVVVTGTLVQGVGEPRRRGARERRPSSSTWSTRPARSSTTPGLPRCRRRRPGRAPGSSQPSPSCRPGPATSPPGSPPPSVSRAPAGCVLSVPMPSAEQALQTQAELAAEGFAVGCFRPPSVPDGISRIRLTAQGDPHRRRSRQRVLDRLDQLVRIGEGPHRHRHQHRRGQDRRHGGAGHPAVRHRQAWRWSSPPRPAPPTRRRPTPRPSPG